MSMDAHQQPQQPDEKQPTTGGSVSVLSLKREIVSSSLWCRWLARQACAHHHTFMKALFTFIIGFGLVLTSFGGSTNETASAGQLITRTYKVGTETFVSHLKHLAPARPAESNQELLLRFFKQEHIVMQQPATVLLDEKKGKLLVRTTQSDQDKIAVLIQKIVSGS